MELNRESIVLDPFLGVGTTCLTCRELGIGSLGVEISPLFYFIAKVKVEDYDVEMLRSYRDMIFEKKFIPQSYSVKPFLKRLFPKPVLEDIFFFKDVLRSIDDKKYQDFFVLALMVASEKSSYIYRDGAVVKIEKEKPRIPSLRKAFRRVCNMMIKDVAATPLKEVPTRIFLGDARKIEFIGDESVDAVITSPPYLNKIEYTQCYWPEYELFFPNIDHPSMRSYLGVAPKDVDFSFYTGELPPVAYLYFEDMRKALSEMYRVVKYGGRVVMVVGGGVFPDRVVETDIEVAKIADEVGFTVDNITAVNKRAATTKRVIKIGESRESIIYLSKQ